MQTFIERLKAQFRVVAKKSVLGAVTVLLMVAGANAIAATVTFPAYVGSVANLSFPASMTGAQNAPVGTVLQAVNQNVGVSISGVTCDIQKSAVVNGTPVPGSTTVFQTNVPGVGVKFALTNGWTGSGANAPFSETLTGTTGTYPMYMQAVLVVTGPIGTGTLTTLPSLTVTYSGSCFPTVSATQYVNTGSQIVAATCQVTTGAIQVTLPKALSTNLKAAGATTGASPLAIGLNCASGVKVNVTLSDATTPSNRTNVLSLASGSSASGLGIQILYGSTPISYGADSATAGNSNQWSAGTAAGGAMQIPLTAQYIRTTGTLVPGSVKGAATFTMSYQ